MNAPERYLHAAEGLRQRHTGLSRPYTLDLTPVLERQQRQEPNARRYPRRIPLVLERAHGICVQDKQRCIAPSARRSTSFSRLSSPMHRNICDSRHEAPDGACCDSTIGLHA